MSFKFELGLEAQGKVSKVKGILTSRCECLYGCNRYVIQPPVGADNKVPDSWWVDEDDVEIIGQGVKKETPQKKDRGGPMSRNFP